MPKKLKWFVREELNTLDDLSEDLFRHLAFQRHRQFFQYAVDIFGDDLLVVAIVLNVKLDVALERIWDAVARRKLQQGVQLDLQVVSPHIDLVEDGLDVTNDVGVKADAEDHPNDGDDSLIVPHRAHISIPHGRQRLKSPIHGRGILDGGRLID